MTVEEVKEKALSADEDDNDDDPEDANFGSTKMKRFKPNSNDLIRNDIKLI